MNKVLDVLDRAMSGVTIVAMALMVAVVSVQVLLRYVFNSSLDWADDIGRLLFVAVVFFAIPIAIKHNAHVGIDLLVGRLPHRFRDRLARLMAALSAAMMVLIAIYAMVVAQDQWSEMLPTVELTVAAFMLPVAIGAAHSALHLLHYVLAGPPEHSSIAAE